MEVTHPWADLMDVLFQPILPTAKPLRVIVVDDHEWIRQIAVQVVRNTLPDAEIMENKNGLEALVDYLQNGADFVVTNHYMPIMTGMALIQELRTYAPHLPIVMISIHPEARADAERAGADWFLTKEQIMEQMPRLLLESLCVAPGLPKA